MAPERRQGCGHKPMLLSVSIVVNGSQELRREREERQEADGARHGEVHLPPPSHRSETLYC